MIEYLELTIKFGWQTLPDAALYNLSHRFALTSRRVVFDEVVRFKHVSMYSLLFDEIVKLRDLEPLITYKR